MAQGHIRPPNTPSSGTNGVGRSRPLLSRRLRSAAPCVALAATPLHHAAAQTPAPNDAAVSVDIPGGPLDSVLGRFAGAAGVALSFDAKMTAGRASSGLQGRVTVSEGFARLLAGSGLTWRFVDARTVVLERPVSDGAVRLSPVTVEGAAGSESAWGPVQGLAATRSATGSKTDTR